jgi:TetR/AcrR family fatty acid metabolism transcriptional regulator
VPSQKRAEARKQQILRAAERVFARKGFQEATISDVAREAEVSDATIYEYFASKEELLFSIPGETARKGKEKIESILKLVRGTANKIRVIIYDYLWFYKTHPDYASVAMLILKQNRKFLETNAYEDVRELSRMILKVIREGVEDGDIKANVDPHLLRSVILGTIEHMVIRWVLLGKPENLEDYVDPLTDLIMEGIASRQVQGPWNVRIMVEPSGKGAKEGPKPERG